MKILGIIPARYASTRFPGKPLANMKGKSMIQRVYEQVIAAQCLEKVIIATDDQRIYDHVKTFGGDVVMTSGHHASGTDRCAEVAALFQNEFEAVINIQGDEPFIQPEQIETLAQVMQHSDFQIATLAKTIETDEALWQPNVVKVIFSNQKAIYFSRHPIPYLRNHPTEKWLQHFTFYKHIGMYAYKTPVLLEITALPPSPLELSESLEQLRWLENGYHIGVEVTRMESIGIDTPEDLAAAIRLL